MTSEIFEQFENDKTPVGLETLKTYSKEFDYNALLNAYTNDFYPACAFENFNDEEIHNLFIALMKFLKSNNATDEIMSDTFKEISYLIANFKNSSLDENFKNIQSKVPELEQQLNYVYQTRENPSNPYIFYQNLASHLYSVYKDNPQESQIPYTLKQAPKEPRPDFKDTKTSIFQTAQNAIQNFFNKNIKTTNEKIIERNTDRLFEQFKDPTLLNFVPEDSDIFPKNQDWINEFAMPSQFSLADLNILQDFTQFPEKIAWQPELQTVFQTTQNETETNTILEKSSEVPQPEQNTSNETVTKTIIETPATVTHPTKDTHSLSDVIRTELTAVFDEFALMRGYV